MGVLILNGSETTCKTLIISQIMSQRSFSVFVCIHLRNYNSGALELTCINFRWQSLAWNSLESFKKERAEREEWALESRHGPGEWKVATERNWESLENLESNQKGELSQWHKKGNFKKEQEFSIAQCWKGRKK